MQKILYDCSTCMHLLLRDGICGPISYLAINQINNKLTPYIISIQPKGAMRSFGRF